MRYVKFSPNRRPKLKLRNNVMELGKKLKKSYRSLTSKGYRNRPKQKLDRELSLMIYAKPN